MKTPIWTQKDNLYRALEEQSKIDEDKIFGPPLPKTVDLSLVFSNSKWTRK